MWGLVLVAMFQAAAAGGDGWKAGLQPMGWVKWSESADTVLYTRAATQSVPPVPGHWRIWNRYEKAPGATWRTTVDLVELDCSQRRIRTLQETAYSGSNMEQAIGQMQVADRWDYPVPGTFADNLMQGICIAISEPSVPVSGQRTVGRPSPPRPR